MLHCTLLSVHGGQGPGAAVGGLMDDGGFTSPITSPRPPQFHSPLDVIESARKAQSLPGFYNRPNSPPTSPPQNFREAFASSYRNQQPLTPIPSAPTLNNRGILGSLQDIEKKEEAASGRKSKKFLGGIFRRKRKENSSSSHSESEGDEPKRNFFSRRGKKKDTPSKLNKGEGTTELDNDNTKSSLLHGNRATYLITTDTGKILKMSPTGSLGREVARSFKFDGQPLGIPRTAHLGIPGVSASHDSLVESAYGSINSSLRSSKLGRSSSTDTIARKEKKEALKARVERLRERNKGSSSDEDLASGASSLFGSGSSLNRSDSLQLLRTRSSRTERYIRRKSQELETLKIETEKDKRNREAVQARILEIQKTQKSKIKIRSGTESQEQLELYEKPKWNGQLINQDIKGFGSETYLSGSYNSSLPQFMIKRLPEASYTKQPSSLESHSFSGNVPPKSFYNMHSNQRSVSYENHINKASSLPPQIVNKVGQLQPNSFLHTPPAPPPRDRSSMLSPYDIHRPISYSFENLNQDNIQRRTPQPPIRIDASVSPVPPKLRDASQQLPPASPCRRSFSERYLNQNETSSNYSSLPVRPALPKLCTTQEPTNPQLALGNVSYTHNQFCPFSYQPFGGVISSATSPERTAQSGKILAIPNMPPSPSSDYSSYVSDNSLLVQHGGPPTFVSEGGEGKLNSLSFQQTDLANGFKTRNEVGRTRSLPLPERVVSVVPRSKGDREEDSDSGSQSSNREQQSNRKPQNRPLSIVTEKSESGDKDSPPFKLGSQPHSQGVQKPQPPKRNNSSVTTYNRELFKQQLDSVNSQGNEVKNLDVDQKFREFFLKEKERLERSKCANFEEALLELETIYKSLNLNNEDILEGAERRESGSMTPLPPRPTTPDKTLDDLHYRRVQANNRNQPDVKNSLQVTGSYLLVSPVLGPPPLDSNLTPASSDYQVKGKEPDIISDDVIVRNIQRANSLKVVDPQPPFGIPVGPVTQGPRTDYMSTPQPPSPVYRPNRFLKAEPDIVTDDVAFRNLRKDGGNTVLPNRSLNMIDFEELLLGPRAANISRSRSVPRTVTGTPSQKKTETQTPRKVKLHQKAKRGGKFYDTFKEAMTDGEGGPLMPLSWRQGPSWVERANLSNNKWDNFNITTEIQTDLASGKAVSQPDIRYNLINESRHPSGRPEESMNIEKIPFEPDTSPVPVNHLLKVRSASCIPSNSQYYKLLDPVCNTSPKPFSLNAQTGSKAPVDVEKLDHLISTLSQTNGNAGKGSMPASLSQRDPTLALPGSIPSQPDVTFPNINEAKTKIQNAILNSFSNSNEELTPKAQQSPAPEGWKDDSRSSSSNSSSDILEGHSFPVTSSKVKKGTPKVTGPTSASQQDKESEKRRRRLEYEKQRLRQERKRTPEGEEKERKKKREDRRHDPHSKGVSRSDRQTEERRSPSKYRDKISTDGGKRELNTQRTSYQQLKKSTNSYNDAVNRNGQEHSSVHEPVVKPVEEFDSEEWIDGAMVQEGRGSYPDKTSPLKPIRTSLLSGDEKAEQEKRDRIQRYKEERRKQMAARYGTKETSSSDEENGLCTSTGNAYKRRRRPRSGLGSSNTDLQNIDGRRSHTNESLIGSRKRTKDGVDAAESSSVTTSSTTVQSTNAAPGRTTTPNNNENHSAQDESPHAFGIDPSSEPSTQHTPPQEGRVDSADSTLSGSEGRLGSRRRPSGDEKDKSHKRKSHLNRASTSEEAVYPPAPLSHLSDSNGTDPVHELARPLKKNITLESKRMGPKAREEIPRRRRRRTPQGASESPYNSSPSNTTPDATLRLTPPTLTPSALASSDLPGFSHSTIKSQQGGLPPVTPFSSVRGSTELQDSDNPSHQDKTESLKGSHIKGTTPHKFTPSKFGHLRKPEIPDVLRPKEQSYSSITSPGVLTPSNSRPSSVVLEKPPLGPEGLTGTGGGSLRGVSGLRSSLRKGTESGTCFMASRRERREDEDLKNGDESPDPSGSTDDVREHIDHLTSQALQLKSRVDLLSEENMVMECEQYLQVNKNFPPASRSPSSPPRDIRSEESEGSCTQVKSLGSLSLRSKLPSEESDECTQASGMSGLRGKLPISPDSCQKNWLGGSEGSGEQVVRRLAFEEKVRERPSSSAVPSGPPHSLDNGVSVRKNSITCRREEEYYERSSQGILKKASFDFPEGGDPRPILKKKSSVDDDPFSSDSRKSILKKKSLTDDELDWDRPRSILKGARSREDLMDRSDSVPSPPTPILKRGSKDHSESECGELRPILKRRETTDGVRSLIGSTLVRRDSAPLPIMQPSHGILKKRPSSPSLELITSGERPLSVAERVAGMEATQVVGGGEPVGGAIPKIRSRPSSGERPSSPGFMEREVRRSSWVPPSSHMIGLVDEGCRPPSGSLSPKFGQSTSRVSQKAAFFAQLEQEKSVAPFVSPPLPSAQARKERGTRFATQPITEGEVTKAAQLLDPSSSPTGRRSPRDPLVSSDTGAEVSPGSVGSRIAMWSKRLEELESQTSPGAKRDPNAKRKRARFQTQPVTMAEVAIASALNDQQAAAKSASHTSSIPDSPVLRRQSGSGESIFNLPRRSSAQELRFEDGHGEVVRGILKTDSLREKSKDSPRSILKPDSRKSSFSEGEHPRGILKSESPMSSTKGSPEHEGRSLKSVLKKDSSSEDSKEIKSILKPESESLEPDISSDSSSELTAQDLNSSYSASDTVVQTVNQSLVASFASGGVNSQALGTPAGDSEYFSRRSSSVNQQVMEEAVKQALPMKTRDNLAEALRQIEPIRDKSRERDKDEEINAIFRDKSRERDKDDTRNFFRDKEDETRTITKEDVISNIREKAGRGRIEEKEGLFLSPFARLEDMNGRTKSAEDIEINEMEASFEESMRSLSGLNQEMKASKERVTYRHKTRQQKIVAHKDRWTLNDFSSCSKMDSPIRSPPSSDSSSGSSSSPVGLLKSPPLEPKFPDGVTFSSKSFISSSSVIEREATVELPPVATPTSSSINARLQSLQKNGEDGWKCRVQKDDDPLLSPQLPRSKARPTSLLDRVSQLETSSQQWRDRVTQSDATKFTVAHKMASASSVPSLTASEEKRTLIASSVTTSTLISSGEILSPASERKKRSPQPRVFKSKTGSCIPELLTTAEPTRKESRGSSKDFARSISIPSEGSKEQGDDEKSSTKVVSIPRLDDDQFDSFFVSSKSKKEENSDVIVNSSDFDVITKNISTLVVQRREVRVTRKNQTRHNPLKSLAQRGDLKDEYTQVDIGAGERELRRMKVEELSKTSSLAMEALAGLASKENFSAVALRKVDDTPVTRELAPYSELMLLQIKGRRHPQVRLVKPRWESINQGDDFLLITPYELFHYKGRYSNVIERAVASEMALYILQTKDMGVTSALRVTDIEEGSPAGKRDRFWNKLGGSSDSKGLPPGPPEADDYIEIALIASNKVFEVRDQALVPLEEAWGQSPKYELLSSDKVLVFDFGSEVYLWAGKRSSLEEKRKGTVLVKELWKENYDYSDCDVNPVFPPVIPGETGNMTGPRPEWGICGKITENVETILFKEKFIDWPDTAQQSRIKEVYLEVEQKAEPVSDLEPCDVTEMMKNTPEEPDLVLEMSHLGRGVSYYDEEERRMHNISTNDIKVWHITENEKRELAGRASSQFFSGEAYVVRWYYHVTATGRTLKGTPSRHNVTGRSRVAYFFWQGATSSLSDKGVSALMTVELDEERGPHVRVTMGYEPPAFLGLFNGGLVVHEGKRDAVTRSQAKLFVVRGEVSSEAHLIEVGVNPSHLRSRGCVVGVNPSSGVVHLWVGAKTSNYSKEVGLTAAKLLCESPPGEEFGWRAMSSTIKLREEKEGRESEEFLELFGSGVRLARHYFSVAKDVGSNYDWTPRVWKLDAGGSGVFQASEFSTPYRATDRSCAFPVWQEELYSAQQPALFLIDAGVKIYLWQGWVPEDTPDDDASASVTGSTFLRFTFARRAALQTLVLYARRKEAMVKSGTFKNGTLGLSDCASILSPKLVVGGMESLEFTNLFPFWKPKDDVTQIQEREGRWKPGVEHCALDVLNQISKERYTLEELQMRPLPDGVDPSRLEKYLSDEEFKVTLGVTKREFLAIPPWKQLQLKKKGNLF